jgi:nitrogen-specific signal transduction histidine kinase
MINAYYVRIATGSQPGYACQKLIVWCRLTSSRPYGLGFSLSYEMVTKEHQGQLRVDSSEGKGTEITITLPVKQAVG